ncbi:Probable M18 family aminopeptidase 2 [uncultured Roseburia sp.]|uniref:M18 family aminopeptidase n=1 Tax=Brotonthovivens ammoniilytica TaxID=2981725 RepID=A0ABT2TLW5_9FIRM|nr:M18 family aminopeptidase [Brotonthovivens ammoniilytica]MCU6763208.1 M18 family aminopeptidase [Brotonthovivens ammoniilytica]SCJ06822.1 Probable M18 family aminopeptidase 2 [uncultured Roseburia sp.]
MEDLTYKSLMGLLKKSVSPYHTVIEAQKRLKESGFKQLPASGRWELQPNGKYFVEYHGSTMFAFTIGEAYNGPRMLRIAAAHTDFPGLVIKSRPDLEREGYRQLNVEVYGGAILNTWLDRPLSAAGKVMLRSENIWEPEVRYVNFEEPFLTIPNLAIHMNREVNKGIELNRQTDLLPVMGLAGEYSDKECFLHVLAEHLNVEKEEILEYDLRLYCAEPPVMLGSHKELISSPHLDNTTSVEALLEAVTAAGQDRQPDGIRLIALFDHEEIGSRTKQGAASMLMPLVIKKIAAGALHLQQSFSVSEETLLEDAMMLSVDVAHGVHPNYSGKMDLTNHPVLGGGFCIKEASSQSYATDCGAIAVLKQICEAGGIPYQTFVNRSDQPGGGTLGSAASSFLPIPVVDIGIPLLAMHSARELMGRKDMKALSDCVRLFFNL